MAGDMTLTLRINADGTAAVTNLKQVEGAVTGLGKAGSQSATGVKRVDESLVGVAKRSHEASYGVSNLTKSLQGMAITAGAAVSVAALARSFIQANIESQRLSKGLEAITGSTGAGAAELRYLQATADKLGLSLAAVSPAFVNLSAATKGTALEGQATRDIFEAVSLAMSKLGKSSADTQGALLAIEQMISKGTVSAEELRGQLGERLPGAFRLAAQAMGVSEQELGKMLEKGDILATDLLPRLAQGLNKLYNDGKEIGGLEAGWNLLVNAMDRAWVSTDKLTNATGFLIGAMRIAAGIFESYSNTLEAISNYNEGLGFRTFADDVAKFGVTLQASNQALKDYVAAREHADNLKNITAFGVAEDAANDADEALIKFQKLRVAAYELKKALDEADAAKQRQARSLAVSVGDDAIRLYREHEAAVKANGEALDGLNGKYDKSIARAAEYKKMEEAVSDAIKLGTMTKEEGKAALERFAAAQDKAAESSGRHAGALSKEAQIVAETEQKYGLFKGQLDAIWKLESNRGKGAGVESSRWVADLAAGSGHMTKIVGEFQMAEKTAKGLGANMGTFAGQADAAAKYLAQAAAKGKTLWEQFAYYHGGPNEKAWGEKTRAYADAAVKIVADATGTMQDLGQNTGKVITDTLNQAINTVESLIQRYLPARYAAEEYAKAQQALALGADAANLSQEEQSIILQGLQKDLENSKTKAIETADAWTEVWKNTVKRIDDTFAGLWKDLFSGTKSTLESLKGAISSWLAEVAHALLTKPLVVAITTAMVGGTGTAGATGATGATGAASNLGGLSNLWSMGSGLWNGITSLFSGSAYSGIISGFNTAWSAISSQGYFGAAGGLLADAATTTGGLGQAFMMSAPYLLPLAAIAGLVLNKFFADQKPRYGAWSATVGNNPRGLEDWENGPDNYSKGGFGLTFGLSDNGSKNMDASEFKDQFDAFAQITQMLADFFGKSLSDKIQAGLESAAFANWTKDGVMRLAANGDMAGAFKGIIDMIADQAAVTGEHLGVAFEYALGDLTGTAEEMANQVQVAMQAAAAYTLVADAWDSHMGEMMALTGDFGADIRILGGYVAAFSNDGENAAQTLARIAAEISALEYAATITTTAIEGLSGTALIQMAEDLADAFGSIDVAAQALAFYGQNFQHAGELFAIQARAAMEQINRIWKDLDFGEAEQIIPATRAEFTALIKGLDLTTESGRELFAELMKLSPMFDVLFDGMDAFVEWLSPADKTKLALERITQVFEDMGIKLPNTRDELLKLYESGGLTIEQMAVLGSYLDELKLLFGDVGDNVVDLTEKLAAQRLNLLDLAEQLDPTPYGSHDRIMQAEQALRDAGYKGDIFDAKRIAEFIRAIAELEDAGGDAGAKLIKFAKDFEQVFDDIARIASEKVDLNIRLLTLMGKDEEVLALQRQREMDAIDESNRWILKRIYALEDEQRALEKRKDEERKLIEDEYQSRMDAIQAERDALDEAHQAQMEALSKQRDAANEALSAANGLLNSIQSALNSIRGSQPVDEFSRIRAQRQMAAWAASGTLPEQEALDRALGTISRTSANDFASESAYRLSKQTDYANLLVLEGLAGDKVDWAEKTVESLDKQAEMLDDYYQQSLDALDKQAEMVSDWRDAQLERIDKLVINSDDILTKLDWLNPGAATGPVMVDANNGADFQALRDEIAGLRADLAAIGTAQVTPLKSIDERLRKFDNDGMPPSRDGEVLLRAA